MKKSVIVVAGGTGTRMNSPVAKQMMTLGEKTILEMAIDRFIEYDKNIEVVLVLHESLVQEWLVLKSNYHGYSNIRHTLGGQERFHSVKNGLDLLSDNTIVGIHDAARPAVSVETIERCYEGAKQYGVAVPVVELSDSLRLIKDQQSFAVNRGDYRIVQTPQCFRRDILTKAYAKEYRPEFTDDASVVEEAGYEIKLVDGNRENIKVTNPEDLIYLKALIQSPKH